MEGMPIFEPLGIELQTKQEQFLKEAEEHNIRKRITRKENPQIHGKKGNQTGHYLFYSNPHRKGSHI